MSASLRTLSVFDDQTEVHTIIIILIGSILVWPSLLTPRVVTLR